MNMLERLTNLAGWGMAYADWYDDAREFILTECERHGWDHDDFINVMAVLSPRISVKRNWDLTVQLFETGRLGRGVIRSTRVALKHYQKTGEIRGPKTSAFARALHGDTTALVLDTWMAKALCIPHAQVTGKANMKWAKVLMQDVAERQGLTVRSAQAAVWAGICKSHGVTPGTLETAVLRTTQMSLEF